LLDLENSSQYIYVTGINPRDVRLWDYLLEEKENTID